MTGGKEIDNQNSYGSYYSKWKTWDQESFGRLDLTDVKYFSKEVSRVKRQFPAGSKVLEVGFGGGKFLAYASLNSWDIYGIETNPDLVKMAISNGFVARHQSNLKNFDDSSFDLIVAFDVLEHLSGEELTVFFTESNRVLRGGGALIVRFPNGDSPFGLVNQNGDITHKTFIGSGVMSFFANKTGMQIVFIGRAAQVFLGKGMVFLLHRILFTPLKLGIDFIVSLVFFPKRKVAFCWSNMVAIFRKEK